MTLHFFDDESWHDLLPLSYTRPLAAMRCGLYTPIERASKLLTNFAISFITQPFLQQKYKKQESNDALFINGKWIFNNIHIDSITQLKNNEGIKFGVHLLAFKSQTLINTFQDIEKIKDSIQWIEIDVALLISQPWDIFSLNAKAIDMDWAWTTANRKSEPLSNTNTLIGDAHNLFIEPGASIEASTLNTTTGKIYIGLSAEIMEGSTVRGPMAMCEHSVLKMDAKVYGATTIGVGCKVGGEVGNVVFFANSSKAHDGFMGNSVVGEWCNFGADSNNSNLKNNYEEVKLWSERTQSFSKTGLQFCGLIMADHSKCGINTMFNTGTVVGVSCNLFGAGFPRNFIPSFSWGGAQGYSEYKLNKAFQTMEKVLERRQIILQDEDKEIFQHIFNHTQHQRNF